MTGASTVTIAAGIAGHGAVTTGITGTVIARTIADCSVSGRYYSPYRSHRYSRINIGFRLDNLFFGSRYYINDPWRYRLPDVYGPYRWVRYYNDVVLVDIYNGEVVDVIYDFFW